MALVSACAVFGLLRRNAIGAYRQAAGIGPPNTCSVPLSVRVSAMILTAPSCSSLVITGSVLEMASIWPLFRAAIAPAPVPTPTMDTSVGLSPSLASS